MPNSERKGPEIKVVVHAAAPAVVLAAAILVPFLGKPFTNDDVTFLLEAQHVLTEPLHPTAFEMVFHGESIRLSRELVTGPVMAYLLVPSVILGGAEWAAHSIQIALIVLTTIAIAGLALRLGLDRTQATVACLLVVASPAVLGMAATAMPDVAAMAFAVAGMERITAWRHSRRLSAGFAAALLFALATLSRPHLLLLLPCAALLLMDDEEWHSRPWRFPADMFGKHQAPLWTALVLIGLVVYLTRDPASGKTIAGATLGRMQLRPVAFNLASFGLHWALAFPLVFIWPQLRGRRLLHFPRTPIAFYLGMGVVWSGGYLDRDSWGRSVTILLLVGLSSIVIADILGEAWKTRDKTAMVLGAWMLIAAAAALYAQLPPKLLVPSAPAMAILIARQCRFLDFPKSPTPLLFTAIGMGITLAILIIRADAALAEVGREGGRVVAGQVKAGKTVWMDGAWGFQWYAMAAGARPMADTPPFARPGSVAVASLKAHVLTRNYPNKSLLYRKVIVTPGGRVHGEGAGFFDNRVGPWPWVWGRKELGRIEIWRIDALLDGQR